MKIKKNRRRFAAFICLILFLTLPPVRAAEPPKAANPREGGGICVPILMYHQVKPCKAGKNAITPYEMESDFRYLRERRYTTVNMTELIAYVLQNRPLPENPVILTFDDGYLNNYKYVYPLLQKYDMKIVMSIIGKNTDDFTRQPDGNADYSHTTWDQLREMQNSGRVEIQNHSYNLHRITFKRYGCQKKRSESDEEYEAVLTEDLGKLQKEITQYLGKTPNTFAYPYGQVSAESVPVLKKLGFRASMSCRYGINILTKDPERLFGLRRICRSHGVSARESLEKAMKTLKYRKDRILLGR